MDEEHAVIQEFKDFINKGGVFEAAVGLIMALAFVPVVDGLVTIILLPIIAAVFAQPDFSSIGFNLGDSRVLVGAWINAIISFVIVGFVMFRIVKTYNGWTKKEDEVDGPSEVDLLTEIRDSLRVR